MAPPNTSSNAPPKLLSDQIQIRAVDRHVETNIPFSNGVEIHTRIMPVGALSDLQVKELQSFYARQFQVDGEKASGGKPQKLEEFFEQDFASGKYVELVYDGEKLVGFHTFAGQWARDSSSFIFTEEVGSIDAQYRNLGLAFFLLFRLANAVKHCVKEKELILSFLAIHPNSYRLVANSYHYPKIQTPALERIAEQVYGDKLHREMGAECYVEVGLAARETAKTTNASAGSALARFIGNNSGEKPTRGCPILFPLSKNPGFCLGDTVALAYALSGVFQELFLFSPVAATSSAASASSSVQDRSSVLGSRVLFWARLFDEADHSRRHPYLAAARPRL